MFFSQIGQGFSLAPLGTIQHRKSRKATMRLSTGSEPNMSPPPASQPKFHVFISKASTLGDTSTERIYVMVYFFQKRQCGMILSGKRSRWKFLKLI